MTSDHALTQEGYERMRAEFDYLRSVRRKEVADRIRESKELGDPIENPEYEQAKTEQAALEGRIVELQRILQYATVIDEPTVKGDEVGLGSRVKVHDAGSGEDLELVVVGPYEADPAAGRVSSESPLGDALIGHAVGDTVEVTAPTGAIKYRILEVAN
jgi:transcription elongation factor GreA